jgi:short-subunit dehydrogenase
MNIVITGCSRGIGFALAEILLSNETNKVIGIARNTDKLSVLERKYSNFRAVAYDITQIDEVDLIKQVSQFFSEINILINNAGMLINDGFERVGAREVSKIFETNVFAPAQLIKAFLPYMSNLERGHVINIGSMGGYQGSAKFAGLAWYSASKAALACLTECLAEEYKNRNISFNCLALGAVQTEMLDEAFPGYKAPVNAAQMANYIAQFALNGQKFYNGKVLPVSLSTP